MPLIANCFSFVPTQPFHVRSMHCCLSLGCAEMETFILKVSCHQTAFAGPSTIFFLSFYNFAMRLLLSFPSPPHALCLVACSPWETESFLSRMPSRHFLCVCKVHPFIGILALLLIPRTQTSSSSEVSAKQELIRGCRARIYSLILVHQHHDLLLILHL